MRYAVKLAKDGAVWVATCRDLPAFNSVGDTELEALRESVDGIALALGGYMEKQKSIPRASDKKRGEHWVALPALDVAKMGKYQSMSAKGMCKRGL